MNKNKTEIYKTSTKKSSSGMKILIATPLYGSQIGGPSTYVKILEKMLPKYDISVVVVPFSTVSRWPKIISHILFGYYIFRASKGVDIIYALDPISVGIPSVLVAKVLKKKFFVRIAGDYAWEQGVQRFKVKDHLDVFSKKTDDYFVPVLILKKLQKMVAESAEKVIVPSNYFKRIITNWGVDSKKVKVIHSVAEDVPFQGRKSDLRSMLSFDGKIVVSAGRLVPWKGFEALIDITPKLVEKYGSFKLLIAGDGPQMKSLSKMVVKKKLDNYVAITGSLEREVLFKYIRVADVFVLNTNYEGLSHQLLETISIGTPVITTDVGGNPELIDDKINGLLVSFNNKKELYESIVSVLDSQTLSEKLVRNAKTKLKKFNSEDMVTKLIKEFNKKNH